MSVVSCGKDSRGAGGVLERNVVERKNEARAEPRIACFLPGERSRTWQKAARKKIKFFAFFFEFFGKNRNSRYILYIEVFWFCLTFVVGVAFKSL